MTQQRPSGWEGWKSIILLVILLHFLNPFKGSMEKVVSTQEEIKGDIKTVAQVQTMSLKDYHGGLSEAERKEILAQIKWETNDSYTPLGSPDAKKGGKIRLCMENFPATIRTKGKNANTTMNTLCEGMVYETLLNLSTHPYYFYPALANKWSVADDKVTFYYSINENAKWADGKFVKAQDVVATWDLLTDKEIQDPFTNNFWNKFERPVALNDQVVMVKAKEKTWRNFIYFSSQLFILPSHVIGDLSGEDYLKKFNNSMIFGSGAYELKEYERPSRISFARRKNYWAQDEKQNLGMNNFDKIDFWFVEDENLIWEKFKKGDFDFTIINMARRWVNEMDFDKVKKGWIQRRKVFNLKPKGTQGFSFNIREFPFDDINVRKAFAYLWPRGLLMEKLMYNEYEYIDSFFEDSPNKGDKVPKVRFNPDMARKFLAESGWTERNNMGYLEKDGKALEVTLNYVGKGTEKFFTKYQEELKNVGIRLNLKEVTWATYIKEVGERNFQLAYGAYTGSSFPMPEYSFHSKYADQNNSGNRWGYKNKEVDKLSSAYEASYDPEERTELLQKIDNILTNDYLMAFAWYGPAERVAYWDKFSYPFHVFGKTGDWRTTVNFWWYDEAKASSLKDAVANDKMINETEEDYKDPKIMQIHPWDKK
jgi:microcin C transport system substrate-binding protein